MAHLTGQTVPGDSIPVRFRFATRPPERADCGCGTPHATRTWYNSPTGTLVRAEECRAMNWWPWSKEKSKPRKLRATIERHLGIDLSEAQSVAHEIKPIQRVNVQRVIDRW